MEVCGEIVRYRVGILEAAVGMVCGGVGMAYSLAWNLHNLVLGAKDQVLAQFGRDSMQAQTMGYKRTSERKAPKRNKQPENSATK